MNNPPQRDVVLSRSSSPIRVLLAEDTTMGCQLLKQALGRARLGVGEVYTALTSAQAVTTCAKYEIDVALISEDLHDGSSKGLDTIELIRRANPAVRCVLMVRKIRRDLTLEAFRNGAKGVFCRREPIEVLGRCIQAVHKGQIWADSEQLEVILEALVETKPLRVTNSSGKSLLTKREDEVAGLVAEGLTNREVAKSLGLSEHTISNYLFKIYEKLGLSSRVEFVLYIMGVRQQQAQSSTPHTGSRLSAAQQPEA